MKQRQNMPYLLQLQQQSRLYLTSTMVLTFLLQCVSVCIRARGSRSGKVPCCGCAMAAMRL